MDFWSDDSKRFIQFHSTSHFNVWWVLKGMAMQLNGPKRKKIKEIKSPAAGDTCKAMFWPTLGLKVRTFNSSGFAVEGDEISMSAVSCSGDPQVESVIIHEHSSETRMKIAQEVQSWYGFSNDFLTFSEIESSRSFLPCRPSAGRSDPCLESSGEISGWNGHRYEICALDTLITCSVNTKFVFL